MNQIKYKHLNLENITSNLFEMLSKYDLNFLEKPINFIYGTQIIEDFNNRNIHPDNINQIIEFCNYLAIDHQLIQSFIIYNSNPTVTPYQLNLEFDQKYYLPQFMKDQDKYNTNIILETCKLGLSNWLKFSIDNNFKWSNQSFYYAITKGHLNCYQLLCNYDKQNYFQNNLLPLINYYDIKNHPDLKIGNIVYFIKDNIIENNLSSCPNSAVNSSSSFYNGNIFSVEFFLRELKNKFSFYQIYYKSNKYSRAVKIKIRNNELIIPSIINAAQYSNNWNLLFSDLLTYQTHQIPIKICIYLNSLDYQNIIFDKNNFEIKIPIIKENMNGFNFLILSINNRFNNNNNNNNIDSLILNITKSFHYNLKFENPKGIYGYIDNDRVLVYENIDNFDCLKNIFVDIKNPIKYKKIFSKKY